MKKGSKIFSRSAAGMPRPESAIASTTYSAGGDRSSPPLRRTTVSVVMRNVPPFGMAWIALVIRFRHTCWI